MSELLRSIPFAFLSESEVNSMSSYIPDHIRLNRTDRLYHIRESFRLVMSRFLPFIWTDHNAYATVMRCHREITLINAELYRRKMAMRTVERGNRNDRFEASLR